MASEWDEALAGLGLIPPEEEGQPAQAAGVPSVQGARNFLFAPLPDTGAPSALHSLATSIGPTPGTVANTFLATMGAPPAAKGFLGGASKALDEIEAALASLKASEGKGFTQQAIEAAKSPGLSDAEIEKQLAANPGASIFDLAGVQGPSSPYKPIQSTETAQQFGSLGEFPREVPYLPPEQAVAQGFVTPALHGTRLGEQRWTVPGAREDFAAEDLGGLGTLHSAGKDALRLPEDELGVHFGTPEQAHQFTSNVLGAGYLPRTYPTVLQTGKSLEMPDMGTWHLPKINTALDRLNEGEGYGLDAGHFRVTDPSAHIGEFPADERSHFETIQEMRDYLRSKGYDSVNYINSVEGPGQRSYIMFKPSQEEPNFVAGVRSRFAQFDPSKLARPELAAGLAGAIAAPVLFDEQNRPFFLTK